MLVLGLTRAQALHLLLIMIALPTQYFLAKYTGNDREGLRQRSLDSLLSTFKSLRSLDGKTLLKNFQSYLHKLQAQRKLKAKEKVEESVAIEVLKYRSTEGYFASSPVVRIPRPAYVKYRVGQVIRHKRFGYRGVIAGWDETCRAPKNWINQMHGANLEWRNQPNYLVLVHQDDAHGRGRVSTYVVEENMELADRDEVLGMSNPKIDDYFDFFDGFQYHMRPAMQILYPED